jgi:hypothetical protein
VEVAGVGGFLVYPEVAPALAAVGASGDVDDLGGFGQIDQRSATLPRQAAYPASTSSR